MKVALDAMGGDHAPAVNIGGAKEALELYPTIEKIFLVGDEEAIRAECQKQGLSTNSPRVAIVKNTFTTSGSYSMSRPRAAM